MREILFRGKTIRGNKWIEGNYVMWDLNPKIYPIRDTEHKGYDVYAETVGQFTGIYDKNGKWIFEGDIVLTQPCRDKPYSSKAKFKQHIGVVKYEIDEFNKREICYGAKWTVEVKNMCGFSCYDWSLFFDCEVIGNIHDNPELLEGKNDDLRNKM